VEGTLSHGNNRYANVRNILVSGSTRVASSYHDGSLLSGTLAGGYYFKVSNWTWEPFASLQYSSLDEDSFDETGAGSVNLHVNGRRTQSLVADIGLRFRQALERSNGSLIPELSIAWNHDFDLDDRIVTASFAGSPNATFSVQGQDIERNGVRLGAGVSYVNNKRLTSSLRFGAELRDGYTAQTLAGEVRYEFK
jgi:outer membrane autotransporter protein